MFAFVIGFLACYALGFVQVYRDRREYAARTGAEINPLRIALAWPLAVGPKW